MNKHNQNIEVSDSGTGRDEVQVVRYIGVKNIVEMMEKKQYIEAFTHAQHGIEKILWDKIVATFEGEKAMIIGRTIEESRNGKDRSNTTTAELIKWAHFLRAIDDNEYSDLVDFNKNRNKIIHGHGQWWYSQGREALQKAIRFLEKNSF